MTAVVIFAVGSPLAADYEESLARSGHSIAAGVRNVDEPSALTGDARTLTVAEIGRDLLKLPFAVALFQPTNRQRAVDEAVGLGFTEALSLIDPTSICPRTLSHGRGLYVNAGCTLGTGLRIGDFVLINRSASVGHDTVLSDFVSIGPGAVLAGNTWLGKACLIGAGAVVAPKVRVGAQSIVGPGAVVTRDMPPASLAVGNPARVRARRG